MGVNVHLNIVDHITGEVIKQEKYQDGDSEWFELLQYEVPAVYGNPGVTNEDFEMCYSFRYITIKDYVAWVGVYKPYLDAGWVTTYDKWCYETRHKFPAEFYHELPEGARIEDFHFIEIDKSSIDPNIWLCQQIENYDEEDYIFYYFDH